MSRTMGKRGKRVEIVCKRVIIQGPCSVNWESMEERTEGAIHWKDSGTKVLLEAGYQRE